MDIILWLQSFHNSIMDLFWTYVTHLSSEDFFLLIIPLIFWCIDAKVGVILFNTMVLAVVSNDVLKTLILAPRPNPDQVRVLHPETGLGNSFPSGHTEFATVFWLYIASLLKKWYYWLAAVLIIILVGISRLYLGLHWPIDILGGILVGILVLIAAWLIINALSSLKPSAMMYAFISIFTPMSVLVFWHTEIAAVALGFVTGFNIGYVLFKTKFSGTFPVRTTFLYQLLKIALGGSVLFLLRISIKALFPDLFYFDFVRYFIMGLWTSLVAPIIFQSFIPDQVNKSGPNYIS